MKRMILILGILVLLAGCTELPFPDLPVNGSTGSNGNNDGGVSAGSNGLTVTPPRCIVDGTSCSAAGLTQYSIPRITFTVENRGGSPLTLDVNQFQGEGRGLLTSLCDDYRVKEFRAQKDAASGTSSISNVDEAVLAENEQATFSWFLELSTQKDLSNGSFSCLARFSLSMEQSLSTVKQVQIRESQEIAPVSGLSSYTASDHPAELVIDAKQSLVDETIGGEQKPVIAKAYVLNRGDGEIQDMTAPGTLYPIKLQMKNAADSDCSETQVLVDGGERSRPGVVCRFTPGTIDRSQLFDLVADTTYTYEMMLPPIEISLTPVVVE